VTGSGTEPLKPGLGKPGVGEIHLWCLPACAELRAEFLSGGSEVLSAEERGRHAAITHPGAAGRFLAGRILARRVLGRYLSQTPETIPLFVDAAGKPSLGDGVRSRPAFSLSHAGEETVLAVAGEGDIGVDIEAHSRAPAALRIAGEFYSPAECQFLDRQHGDAADCALTLWTLKESIVKARGHTVWDGLSGVSLSIDGADIVWELPPLEGNHWRLAAGTFRESYKLAIAQTLAGPNAVLPSIIAYETLATGESEGMRFEPAFRS
jgi:phosphopantetheinyl transferase